MAYNGDSASFEDEVTEQNDEIIKLLKAILIGIEIISDQENLIDNVED